MMSARQDIEEKIAAAMKTSCNDAFFFSEDETKLIDAEYLFTVNTAKEIATLNKYIGVPYKIYLEKPTKRFASDCVPLFGKKPGPYLLGYGGVLRKPKNTKRNGKIDIVVYREGGINGIPVCAIELKGFNPSRTVALNDLKRNAEYFDLSCVTGKSQISFATYAALHSFDKTYDEESIARDLNSLEKKYKKWLSELGGAKSFEISAQVFTVSKSLASEQETPPGQDYIECEGYHFAGVMVTFYVN